MQSRWCRAWSRPNLTDFVHIFSKRGYLQCVFVHWRDLETKSKSTAYLLENWNSSTTAPDALFSPWWASTASSDRLCCSSWSCFRCAAALSACTLPAYPRLENHPFRRTRASDVGAALPCLRPGFPILASRQSRRQIEASIDRGQSSRTHATGHAVESPSRLRWQPRIIVRYSRGTASSAQYKMAKAALHLKTMGKRKLDYLSQHLKKIEYTSGISFLEWTLNSDHLRVAKKKRAHFFGHGKVWTELQIIANFSATTVMSLPYFSFCCSLASRTSRTIYQALLRLV